MTQKLIGVFNADGGILGEISYVAGKVSGRAHCDLCDITHGINPMGRKSWREAAQTLPIPMETVHLNEMDERTTKLLAYTTAPAIVLLSPEEDKVLLESKEIAQCRKNPQTLIHLINEKLAQ